MEQSVDRAMHRAIIRNQMFEDLRIIEGIRLSLNPWEYKKRIPSMEGGETLMMLNYVSR